MNLTINTMQKYGFSPKISQRQNIAFSENNSNNLQKDTFEKEKKPAADNLVQTDIFYINDNHGRIGNMARIYTAKTMYDNLNKNSTADKFVLAAGDISAGADLHIVKAANTYMNGLRVDATSDGNHEYDASPAEIAESKKGAKFRSLGMNLQIPKGNPLDGIIEKSFVIEKNGHKYAIIGLAPPDLHERIRDNESRKQIGIDDFEKTLQDIQKLTDEYKKQGINKIILLSHCGLEKDRRIAKETSGIDVIIGESRVLGFDKLRRLLGAYAARERTDIGEYVHAFRPDARE